MSAEATCGRCGFHPDLHFIKNPTTGVSLRYFIPSLFLWDNKDKSVITHPNGVISSTVKTFLIDKILTYHSYTKDNQIFICQSWQKSSNFAMLYILRF